MLLPLVEADIVLADRGFDADERVLIPLAQAGKVAVIRPKPTAKSARIRQGPLSGAPPDENFSAKLKQYRAIATATIKPAQLPRRHPPRRHRRLAHLMTRPKSLRIHLFAVGANPNLGLLAGGGDLRLRH